MSDTEDELPDDVVVIQEGDDDVEAAAQAQMLHFFERCEGRVKPVIIRPDLIMAIEMSEGAWDALPEEYKLGVQYVARFSDLFSGNDQTIACSCCPNTIEAKAHNAFVEIGAFIALFKHDLNLDVGGMVFSVCADCASRKEDKQLYVDFVTNLGGDPESDLDYKRRPANITPEEKLLRSIFGVSAPDDKPPEPTTHEVMALSTALQEDINQLVGKD